LSFCNRIIKLHRTPVYNFSTIEWITRKKAEKENIHHLDFKISHMSCFVLKKQINRS